MAFGHFHGIAVNNLGLVKEEKFMFEELTMNEQYEVEGGIAPAIPLIIKGGIIVVGIIFSCGAVKGCTNEAAK